eukprot:scaffold6480_cov84-Skeletonema_dohrnii-CCMP3373.AAC.1
MEAIESVILTMMPLKYRNRRLCVYDVTRCVVRRGLAVIGFSWSLEKVADPPLFLAPVNSARLDSAAAIQSRTGIQSNNTMSNEHGTVEVTLLD